jgi:hypothetical protein
VVILLWETSWVDGRRPKDIASLFLKLQKGKNASCLRPWRNFFGSLKSTPMLVSRLPLSLKKKCCLSLEHIINLWEMLQRCNWSPTRRTRLLGSSQMMHATSLCSHTTCNFGGTRNQPCSPWFGNHGLPQSATLCMVDHLK